MTGSAARQRGVVTVIAAVFIIVTIALMVEVLHRTAGSDVLDTAVQNDAIEALFIAETGVESASYRYATGTGCAALTPFTDNAGSGSFTVTAATPVGSDCRVRVQGTASSTGLASPDASTRTIDADLRLSNADGWIVGENGTILRWDGAAWNAVASGTAQDLNGVHCVSSSDCWAVGNNVYVRWNGAAWTPQAAAFLIHQAVSCEPSNPNYCVAVGTLFGFLDAVARWDGANWAVVAVSFGRQYRDVSCPSSNCYISSASGSIFRYNGVALVDDASGTVISMNGIDCTSDTDCWAVGDVSGTDWNLDRRTAAGWNPQTVGVSNQANQNLNAVSCVDASDCWAVGNRDGSRYVLGHWNGAGWNAVTVSNGAQRDDLNGVHCIGSNECWAVGNYNNGGNVLRYDGIGWAYLGAAVAANTDLNDVFVIGGGGAAAAVNVVRWQEIVSN